MIIRGITSKQTMENQNQNLGDQAAREELLSEFYEMRPKVKRIKIDTQGGPNKMPTFTLHEWDGENGTDTPIKDVMNGLVFKWASVTGPVVVKATGEELYFLNLQFDTAKGSNCELEVITSTYLACQVAKHLPQLKSGGVYTFKVGRDNARMEKAGIDPKSMLKMSDFTIFADAKDIDYKGMELCCKGDNKLAYIRKQVKQFQSAQLKRDNQENPIADDYIQEIDLEQIFPDDTADLIGEAGKKKGGKK